MGAFSILFLFLSFFYGWDVVAAPSCLRTFGVEKTAAQGQLKQRRFKTEEASQFYDALREVYRDWMDAIEGKPSAYQTHRLPEIRLENIKDKEDLTGHPDFGGLFRKQIIRGRFDGEDVIIKIVKEARTIRNGISEASFAKLMSDLRLGPHFYGVVYEKGNFVGFVTRYVDGPGFWHMHPYQKTPLNKFGRSKSSKIKSFLMNMGIVPHELQYRLLAGQLWIVDTGAYSLFTKGWVGEFDNFYDGLIKVHRDNRDVKLRKR